MKKPLKIICCSFLAVVGCLQASNAAWKTDGNADWNLDANWTAAHPDAVNAIAGFVGFPTTSPGSITSTSDIKLGTLIFGITIPLTIDLGHNLIFIRTDNVNTNSQIFVSQDISPPPSTQIQISNPIILKSNLDIFINDNSNFTIDGSISDDPPLNPKKSLSLFASSGVPTQSNARLTLSGNNTYTGGTYVNTGILSIGGTTSGTTVIPGDIFVSLGGSIQHNNNNHYSATSSMTITGGSVDLSGTNQTMLRLNNQFGTFGGKGTIELLASPVVPPTKPEDAALTIGGNSQTNPTEIKLTNGGSIYYDQTDHKGTAFLPGPTTIDLNTNSVDFEIPHNFYNCVDTDVGLTSFVNGTLNKTGNGLLLLQGQSQPKDPPVTVPTFNINDGTVVIGDQTPAEVVTATGPVTINSPGKLAGFQTLDAKMGVVNSGLIVPGNACTGCSTIGTLTIKGDYQQTQPPTTPTTGTLLIKALNASTSDMLTVDSGVVQLSGGLIFDALPGAVFNPGDQIVILDNPNEATPISGTFSSFFVYNLPPCLQANLIYTAHQVIVNISSCCPRPPCPICPTNICPICPPTNFKVTKKNQNGSHLLKWQPPKNGSLPSEYRIYRGNLSNCIDVICLRDQVLRYRAYNPREGSNTYYIVSVDCFGQTSCPASFAIK